jgi:hypothetical protein
MQSVRVNAIQQQPYGSDFEHSVNRTKTQSIISTEPSVHWGTSKKTKLCVTIRRQNAQKNGGV